MKGCFSAPFIQPRFCSLISHIFGALKVVTCGKRFGSADEVIEEAKKWLRVYISKWYKKGLDALAYRWRKAVEVDGECVEKLGV